MGEIGTLPVQATRPPPAAQWAIPWEFAHRKLKHSVVSWASSEPSCLRRLRSHLGLHASQRRSGAPPQLLLVASNQNLGSQQPLQDQLQACLGLCQGRTQLLDLLGLGLGLSLGLGGLGLRLRLGPGPPSPSPGAGSSEAEVRQRSRCGGASRGCGRGRPWRCPWRCCRACAGWRWRRPAAEPVRHSTTDPCEVGPTNDCAALVGRALSGAQGGLAGRARACSPASDSGAGHRPS
jgi:hypothetical protein